LICWRRSERKLAAQAHAAVRRVVPTLEADRTLAPDIDATRKLISQGT
jgi:histidine ammonia-lyase